MKWHAATARLACDSDICCSRFLFLDVVSWCPVVIVVWVRMVQAGRGRVKKDVCVVLTTAAEFQEWVNKSDKILAGE